MINDYKLQEKFNDTVKLSKYYDTYSKPLAEKFTKELDDKVVEVKTYINKVRELDLDFDPLSLQKIVMDLSTSIYYVNDKLEQLMVTADMVHFNYKAKYNESYTFRQGAATQENRKYTAEQLRSLAEIDSEEEWLLDKIYDNAVSILKIKLDDAHEILKAVSKSLSCEIQSMSTYQVSNKYQN